MINQYASELLSTSFLEDSLVFAFDFDLDFAYLETAGFLLEDLRSFRVGTILGFSTLQTGVETLWAAKLVACSCKGTDLGKEEPAYV